MTVCEIKIIMMSLTGLKNLPALLYLKYFWPLHCVLASQFSLTHTHTHARTHARTHTHIHTHTHHTHAHTCTHINNTVVKMVTELQHVLVNETFVLAGVCCWTNWIKAHLRADASVVSMLATLLLVYCPEWMLGCYNEVASRQCSQAAVCVHCNRKCYVICGGGCRQVRPRLQLCTRSVQSRSPDFTRVAVWIVVQIELSCW